MDIFSMGCILAELYAGRRLFSEALTGIERLALLERVLGPFPYTIVKRGEEAVPGTFVQGTPARVKFPTADTLSVEVSRVLNAAPLSVSIICCLLFTATRSNNRVSYRLLCTTKNTSICVADSWPSTRHGERT